MFGVQQCLVLLCCVVVVTNGFSPGGSLSTRSLRWISKGATHSSYFELPINLRFVPYWQSVVL